MILSLCIFHLLTSHGFTKDTYFFIFFAQPKLRPCGLHINAQKQNHSVYFNSLLDSDFQNIDTFANLVLSSWHLAYSYGYAPLPETARKQNTLHRSEFGLRTVSGEMPQHLISVLFLVLGRLYVPI